MTPLAYRIVKELTLPIKRRRFKDDGGLLPLMGDIHCFEVSEAYPLIRSFTENTVAFDEMLAFLPAPRTWIECRIGSARFGIHLEEEASYAVVRQAFQIGEDWRSACDKENIELLNNREEIPPIDWKEAHRTQELDPRGFIYSALALINSPRVIGRQQHAPHRGLERKLIASRSIIGSFPLHAWTEIKLQVMPPSDYSGDATEAHLTGQRALHFCRAHLRIRLGKLELVRSHWRGDAALGIKQSRYRVVA